MTTKELRDAVTRNAQAGNDYVGLKVCGHGISENSEYARLYSSVDAVIESLTAELGEPTNSYDHEGTTYLDFPDFWNCSVWEYSR